MGFREIYSAKAKRRKDIRAAVNAVRKEARKVSREQAREMLIAELRRHDVDPLPADAAIETMLEGLALTNPWERTLFAAKVLDEAVRPMVGAARDLKEIFGDSLRLEGDVDPINVDPDRDAPTIPVRLEQEAVEWLNARFPSPRRPVDNSIFVLLQPAGADGRSLAVTFNKHRFGILDGADGELFREYVEEGARTGNPVVAEGIREVSDDRRWSLELFRPA